MKKSSWILIVLVFIALGGYFYIDWREKKVAEIFLEDTTVSKIYENSKYGFSFKYDQDYFLEEREVGNSEREHYSIVLTLDTEENKQLREGLLPGREGPTAITIDIFQNNLDKLTALKWIEGINDSNFKLSSGTYTKKTIAGKEAYLYQSSGLYENNNVVIADGDYIYKFSVSWLTSDERIISDFSKLISKLAFYK